MFSSQRSDEAGAVNKGENVLGLLGVPYPMLGNVKKVALLTFRNGSKMLVHFPNQGIGVGTFQRDDCDMAGFVRRANVLQKVM